jgi:solute carrier family 25, member 42
MKEKVNAMNDCEDTNPDADLHHMEMPVAEPTQFDVVSRNVLCGAVAGVLAKTAVAPAERVKMSYQTTKDLFTLSGALERAKGMVKDRGVLSLWRGHSTTVLRVAPFAGFSYAFHDYAEREMKSNLQVEILPFFYKFSAGAIGGACATLLTYPLDVLRVRLALMTNSTWVSTIKQGGLYQGLLPTILGIVPYAGTSWSVKQYLLEHYKAYYNSTAAGTSDDTARDTMYQGKTLCVEKVAPNIIESLVMNAIAGLSGQFVTYPLDVVRRRMQMQLVDKTTGAVPKNMRNILKELIEIEGIRGLSKGFSLNIMKGPITMSISLTAYDIMIKQYGGGTIS